MKLIKLEQPACNPCKMVSNFLDSQDVEYEVVNVQEKPEIAADFSVMSVPVAILLDDEGNEIQRSTGFRPDELEDMISKL